MKRKGAKEGKGRVEGRGQERRWHGWRQGTPWEERTRPENLSATYTLLTRARSNPTLLHLIGLQPCSSHKGVQSTALNLIHPLGKTWRRQLFSFSFHPLIGWKLLFVGLRERKKVKMTASSRLGAWERRVLSGLNINIWEPFSMVGSGSYVYEEINLGECVKWEEKQARCRTLENTNI